MQKKQEYINKKKIIKKKWFGLLWDFSLAHVLLDIIEGLKQYIWDLYCYQPLGGNSEVLTWVLRTFNSYIFNDTLNCK